MDDRPLPLRLVYSDELGQLKVVQTADGAQLGTAALAATWGQPDKLQCIDCTDLGSSGGISDTSSAVLAVARGSGAVEVLSAISGQLLGTIPPAISPSGSSNGKNAADAARVAGLHLIWGDEEAAGGLPCVLSVTRHGTARLHVPTALAEQQQDGGSDGSSNATWHERRSWQVPAEVCCTAYDAASGRLAVGCQGAELRLFDCSTGELAFTFKGGKPNMVGVVDRPWNTAIVFLPPASGAGGADGGGAAGSRLLVGTGHHKLRLYDADAGKRPQVELSWGDARVTCLALEPDGQRCWVGNGKGRIEVLDLRTRKFSGTIRGLAGSARALAAHPGAPVLASVGLDRYLRLHDRHTRQLLAKVYLKTLPTGVTFCPTDASMLAAPPEQQAGAQKKRRRRQGAAAEGDGSDSGGSGAGAGADTSSDSDEEEEPQRGQRQQLPRKHSKQRREGGSGGARKGRARRQRRGDGAGSD